MLDVKELSKSFKDVKAVKHADVHIDPGEIVGLVGPNGAGKTTLIKCICTILNADSGSIEISGHDMYQEPVEAKRKIAYIPEVPNPYEYLTVWEHIEFSYRAYQLGIRDPEDTSGTGNVGWEEKADKYLEMFNLTDKKFSLSSTLSKGQKQKLQIICGFIHDPDLVFMDEPLIGIDPEGAHAMKELIREHNSRGSSFLISSHMLGLIEELCTSILVMQEGRIVWQGEIEDLKGAERGGNLEEAFLQITRPARSTVEDAFENGKAPVRPSLRNLFSRKKLNRLKETQSSHEPSVDPGKKCEPGAP